MVLVVEIFFYEILARRYCNLEGNLYSCRQMTRVHSFVDKIIQNLTEFKNRELEFSSLNFSKRTCLSSYE